MRAQDLRYAVKPETASTPIIRILRMKRFRARHQKRIARRSMEMSLWWDRCLPTIRVIRQIRVEAVVFWSRVTQKRVLPSLRSHQEW